MPPVLDRCFTLARQPCALSGGVAISVMLSSRSDEREIVSSVSAGNWRYPQLTL